MKAIQRFLVLAIVVLPVGIVSPALACPPPPPPGTTLEATVSIVPHLARTYHWTIDKSVTPQTWNLFRGDSGTSRYTVAVVRDEGTDVAWVDGQVCVTNGGDVATENLRIVNDLRNGVPPPNDLIATVEVDVSAHPVIQPGETWCYPYRIDIPSEHIHPGGTYKVTANVTITNHAGHWGDPFGPSPSATANLPTTPTPIYDTVHVDDTNGGSWEFNASGSVSYDGTFVCDADAGQHDNTATIRETGQSDDASVTVNCYALQVTKDARTSFTRTYHWTIDKSADRSELTLAVGEQYLVHYQVDVDATYTDSDWAVSGAITVSNPAPVAATILGVADLVSPAIPATVSCGVSFPYALAAGGTLVCAYSASLPDASSRTNSATATLQNYDYDHTMNPTPAGTTDFSGSAPVVFGNPAEVDECIEVSDTYAGFLGTVCYPDIPTTFQYSRWIGPFETCGQYTVVNTASFITNDTSATGSDSWTVNVQVPCEGCTLTPGYWKTHSRYGPAPYDATWALIGEDTGFFLSGRSWYQVLWTPPSSGNAYYILAHAYIAARLNILNGAASTPEVDAAISWATGFFATYQPSDRLSKPVRTYAIAMASLLDQYNNGAIGPGHCSE